jgi:8-oxo-dGTP pyrophosphatase MutT (NUDIX family)
MPWTADFAIDHNSLTVQVLDGSGGQATGQACSSAFERVINAAKHADAFSDLGRRPGEMYRIIGANDFTYLERSAASLFGIASQGAHMTAYRRTTSGLKIWVARRSSTVTYPNMLDNSVAGGVKAGQSPFDCIIEEADQEASLPTGFVRENAHPVGVITYMTQKKNTGLIRPDVLYVYDIELPEAMIPVPNDGEVAEFYLWDVGEINKAMLLDKFKPNCVLVMIDFYIRHGIITQENEADYIEIATRLRRRLLVPTMPEHR